MCWVMLSHSSRDIEGASVRHQVNLCVCLHVATGPVHAVGLVDVPGRLRQTYLQVPESQPTHRTGPAGEVSIHSRFFHSFLSLLYLGSFFLIR